MRRRSFLTGVSALALAPLIPKTPVSTVHTGGTITIDFVEAAPLEESLAYVSYRSCFLYNFEFLSDVVLADGESFVLDLDEVTIGVS